MKSIVIVPLIGLPGSGKTTFAEMLISFSRIQKYRHNIIYIGFDDLIKIDQSLIDKGLFKETRQRYIILVHKLVDAIHSEDYNELEKVLKTDFEKDLNGFLSKGIFNKEYEMNYVIVDDNNYYRSMRYCFYQIARNSKAAFAQLYFEISSNKAMERNSTRTHKVKNDIIESIAARIEAPIELNTWERNSYTVDSNKVIDFDYILNFLEEISHSPETPLQIQTKVTVAQSDIHKIDLILRKAVHNIISNSNVTGSPKTLLANSLQEKRKSILQDLREGILDPKHKSLMIL